MRRWRRDRQSQPLAAIFVGSEKRSVFVQLKPFRMKRLHLRVCEPERRVSDLIKRGSLAAPIDSSICISRGPRDFEDPAIFGFLNRSSEL